MFLASPSPHAFSAEQGPDNHRPYRHYTTPLQPVRDLNARYQCAAVQSNENYKLGTSSRTMLPGSEACDRATVAEATPKRVQLNHGRLFKSRDEQRSRRRGAFLSKVKEAGEEKKFEARGEQHLRMSFLSSRKAWEEERARLADEWLASPEDEYEEERLVDGEPAQTNGDHHLVEELEAVEDIEMEAIFASAAQAEQVVVYEQDMSDYGNEDDDYDLLLLAMAMQAEREQGGEPIASSADPKDQVDQVMDEDVL